MALPPVACTTGLRQKSLNKGIHLCLYFSIDNVSVCAIGSSWSACWLMKCSLSSGRAQLCNTSSAPGTPCIPGHRTHALCVWLALLIHTVQTVVFPSRKSTVCTVCGCFFITSVASEAPLRFRVQIYQWEAGVWSCDLRANERPWKKLHRKGTTRKQTHRHCDY